MVVRKFKKLKTLLVDDNKINSVFHEKLIDGMDIDYVSIHSGKEALSMMRNLSFDFVLLDLQMPDISGADVLNQLKSKNSFPDYPIFALTANSRSDDLVRNCLAYGFADVLEKPLKPEQLKNLLASWFDYSELNLPEKLSNEDEALLESLRSFVETCREDESELFVSLHKTKKEEFMEHLSRFKGTARQLNMLGLLRVIEALEMHSLKELDTELMSLEIRFHQELNKAFQYYKQKMVSLSRKLNVTQVA